MLPALLEPRQGCPRRRCGRVHDLAACEKRLGFVDVAAVCSTRPEVAREKAGRLGIPKVYEDYEDLLDDPDIELVDIVTPTRLHHPIAMAAMARRKHVIVDKPLALTLDQAREMRGGSGERRHL